MLYSVLRLFLSAQQMFPVSVQLLDTRRYFELQICRFDVSGELARRLNFALKKLTFFKA